MIIIIVIIVGAVSIVRTSGETDKLLVKAGCIGGSTLSPFLFIFILDTLMRNRQKEAPQLMLFADHMILCNKENDSLEEDLDKWRDVLERYGLKIEEKQSIWYEISLMWPLKNDL